MKRPLERELGGHKTKKGQAMHTLLTQRYEGKFLGNDFESVGSILSKLFKDKSQLEAKMTPRFDLHLSLALDDLIIRIENVQQEGVWA